MANNKTELKKVLKLAKEKMPDFDTVIDLFDMTFVYITKKSASLSGHTPKEMIGKHISTFMTTPAKTNGFRNVIAKTMTGKSTIPIKTKTGKQLLVTMDFVTVQVKNHPFLVTKAAKKQ